MERLTNDERERLQRVLAQLSESQAAVEAIHQNISLMSSSLAELSMTMGSLKAIKELKPDTEIIVPTGSETFINAKIARSDRVLIGLGADVVAERSADDAVKVLEARSADLERVIAQASEELERIEKSTEALRPEAEELLKKTKGEPGERGTTADVR